MENILIDRVGRDKQVSMTHRKFSLFLLLILINKNHTSHKKLSLNVNWGKWVDGQKV